MAREIEFVFPLPTGLHARPAALLQAVASRFRCEAALLNRRTGQRSDARSILSLLASETIAGDRCALVLEGPDEEAAARALRSFIEGEFPACEAAGEQVTVAGAAVPPGACRRLRVRPIPRILEIAGADYIQGVPASPGVGFGTALHLEALVAVPEASRSPASDLHGEWALVAKGVERLSADFDLRVARAANATERDILTVHRALARDPVFEEMVRRRIFDERMRAPAAILEAAAEFAGRLASSASRYLAERSAEIHDVAAQITRSLAGAANGASGGASGGTAPLPPGSIVVARRLPPSTFLSLDRGSLAGLVLAEEGPTSHTVILARSFGVPCVSGAAQAAPPPGSGAALIVDGDRGIVVVDPPPAVTACYEFDRALHERRAARWRSAGRVEAVTRDGRRIEVGANICTRQEVEAAFENGADGIGLFRTEFLFLGRSDPPTEEEQVAIYSAAATAARAAPTTHASDVAGPRPAAGRPVVIRLLDIGGDKPAAFLPLPSEPNPFLGRRAVRFYGDAAGVVRTQIRSILRAAAHGDVRIMIPMVTNAAEVALVREMVRQAAGELAAAKVPHRADLPIEIMIEVPAAALAIDRLSVVADSFSVGSNDLSQYLMAADRSNPATAPLANVLDPAFLWIFRKIADDSRRNGRRIGICGEMSGDPRCLPLLVGLGLDEISVPPPSVPRLKAGIRALRYEECRALLDAALREPVAAAVERLLAASPPAEEPLPIVDESLVRLDAPGTQKALVIHELACLLAAQDRVSDADAFEASLWHREEIQPTSIGFGIAIPHCKSPAVRHTTIAMLRPAEPIPWGAPNDEPARLVLLLAVREGDPETTHLSLLARISRRLVDEELREALLNARSPAEVVRLTSEGAEAP